MGVFTFAAPNDLGILMVQGIKLCEFSLATVSCDIIDSDAMGTAQRTLI